MSEFCSSCSCSTLRSLLVWRPVFWTVGFLLHTRSTKSINMYRRLFFARFNLSDIIQSWRYFIFVDVLQTSLQQLQQLQQLQLLQTPALTSPLAPFVLTGASSLAQSKVGAFNWIAGLFWHVPVRDILEPKCFYGRLGLSWIFYFIELTPIFSGTASYKSTRFSQVVET